MESKGYCQKFEELKDFSQIIFRSVKKQALRELASRSGVLFRNPRIRSIKETKEMIAVFTAAIYDRKEEDVAEWTGGAWLDGQGEVFRFFHEKLLAVTENYDTLTALPSEKEEEIYKESVSQFGFATVYIFSVLNSVVFSEKTFAELRKGALAERETERSEEETVAGKGERAGSEALEKLAEKYEKRILGITDRYKTEIEGYRKQIGKLQKKIEELNAR